LTLSGPAPRSSPSTAQKSTISGVLSRLAPLPAAADTTRRPRHGCPAPRRRLVGGRRVSACPARDSSWTRGDGASRRVRHGRSCADKAIATD
jgi:hypothetical protein